MGLAPAQDAIRYKNVVFNSGWGDQKSIYMGPPSEENNQAWDDLHVGMSSPLMHCELRLNLQRRRWSRFLRAMQQNWLTRPSQFPMRLGTTRDTI